MLCDCMTHFNNANSTALPSHSNCALLCPVCAHFAAEYTIVSWQWQEHNLCQGAYFIILRRAGTHAHLLHTHARWDCTGGPCKDGYVETLPVASIFVQVSLMHAMLHVSFTFEVCQARRQLCYTGKVNKCANYLHLQLPELEKELQQRTCYHAV